MPDREDQIQPPSAPTGLQPSPPETVAADVVSAPRRRAHDLAIAQRLRHGLLRRPLGIDGPPRW